MQNIQTQHPPFHNYISLLIGIIHIRNSFTLHTACNALPCTHQKVEWKKIFFLTFFFVAPYIFYDYCYYYYEWLEVNYTTRQNGILLPLVFHFYFFIFHFTARGISFNIVLIFTLAAKPPVMDVICVRFQWIYTIPLRLAQGIHRIYVYIPMIKYVNVLVHRSSITSYGTVPFHTDGKQYTARRTVWDPAKAKTARIK